MMFRKPSAAIVGVCSLLALFWIGSTNALSEAEVSGETATIGGYVPTDIGFTNQTPVGRTEPVAGGHDVTGGGREIGGRSDQFHFAYETRTGNFDMRVRVAGLSITDPFVQAGLMARASLESNAPFVGVFTSSPQIGCFVESRSSNGGVVQTAARSGGFPANYPQAWLRLTRQGNVFTGYGSFDGTGWHPLGTVTLDLPSPLYFGMAVSSHDTNAVATAQFRDLGPVVNGTETAYVPRREPLGPSNRRTGLIISEIMYHPPDRPDGKELEYVEIYNAESIFVDLTGWRLAGGIQYTFPEGFTLEAGEFAVVALDPAAVEAEYGITGVLGPYSGRLNNAGDQLLLLNGAGAVRCDVEYGPDPPWPVAADGAGHSIYLAYPSYGESDPRAWAASDSVGGSPGRDEGYGGHPLSGVRINEFLAQAVGSGPGFVELFNTAGTPADLSGCILTDDWTTNRFLIPDGVSLAPGGFLSFDSNQLGFGVRGEGGTLYLFNADRTRVLDAVRFGGQESGVSSGRTPDGGPEVRRLAQATPGEPNGSVRQEAVVISEIMYHPISADDREQYIEIHNASGETVPLGGWQFIDGIEYVFPEGAAVPAGGYVIVAKELARLRPKYPHLTDQNAFGDFSGSLSRSGERVVLAKPGLLVSTNLDGTVSEIPTVIPVSEVTYGEGGRWPELADGGGSSLELIDPRSDIQRASNWAASDESAKAEWTSVEFTGPLNLGQGELPANRFQILRLGAGECLIDDVEILGPGGTNLLTNGDFEGGATGWRFFGNHSRSEVEQGGAASGQGVLRVRSSGDGDTGNNAIRANMTTALRSGQTATIRAKVRWVSGWPEVLFRVRGNWIELPARMRLPDNLGTPAQPNSRRMNNAGPAIYDVTHRPALPRQNEPVVVTCRVSDPDGFDAPRLRFRVDPSGTLSTVVMRDDGLNGDAVAGDGIYSGRIGGRASGTLVAFRIEATDRASTPARSVFPSDAPDRECLIRWNDPIPFGNFAHYHLWMTEATERAFNGSPALDNTYRDATLVYGDFRVVYNAGFRSKGSPYHGGAGDLAVTVPKDDLLLGTDERVFGSTGNGGSESTGMRGDVSAWIGQQMGIPYLHSHYMRLYRNGTSFREVLYDLEQPNRDYAEDWFGGGNVHDDLYKIAVWFEFEDNNSGFRATGATIQRFLSEGEYKLARYRWNWQIRPSGDTANDYTSLFNLVTAANATSDRVNALLNVADVEQWMRVFAFNRVLGNWDAWTFSVGQNMYLYAPIGRRATLMPWDIDFVLGEGNGPSDGLWGGQDPVVNQLYDLPAFRRMLWRAYQDAINGPLQPERYGPQIDARRNALLRNGVTGVSDPRSIRSYIDSRRNYIERQLANADADAFTVTSPSGDMTVSSRPSIMLTGKAPFAVASIEVNGIAYPVTWSDTTTWRLEVPLGAGTNSLRVVGLDLRGNPVEGATSTVRAVYSGAVPDPADWVVINEIMYHPPNPDAEYLELHNRHPSAIFNLSGYELRGVDFRFPDGSVIGPNGFLVVTRDRTQFALEYGASVPVAGVMAGRLDNAGETIRLIRPGATANEQVIIDEVTYGPDLPWAEEADGDGPSLQLIDAARDNRRPANWAVAAEPNHATPGRPNSVRNLLEVFPEIWINEILPANSTGAADNAGEREPWIELYNSGNEPVNLAGYYLTDDLTDLRKWSIPSGTTLGAGQYLVIWADGEPAESTPQAPHANFRLNPTNGVVALSRTQLGSPGVLDFVVYRVTSVDRAYGSVPDGDPFRRRVLHVPTPGALNDPTSPEVPVFINEWMASNRAAVRDPADNSFDDWFELYNAGNEPVDLSGYYLARTLDLGIEEPFQIPDGTLIGPGGFLIVWADEDTEQNGTGSGIHVDFRLPAEGGEIGLFGPGGVLVDGVTFGSQVTDVSEGRFPDGGDPPYLAFATPTPGTSNVAVLANRAPSIAPVADASVLEGERLVIPISASDPDQPEQSLRFELAAGPEGAVIDPVTGEFSWTPGEAAGPGMALVTVRVVDNGNPPRSASRTFGVTVTEANQPPVLAPIEDVVLDEGMVFGFRVNASDPDLPPQTLVFELGPGAPAGAAIDPVTGEFSWIPAEDQGPGTYTILVRVTDGGSPPLSAERMFVATVREVNNPPVVVQVPPQSVDEETLFQIQIEARDPDAAQSPVSFALVGAPEGVLLDPVTGLLRWTPGEEDGPRDHNITVEVTEAGGGPSSLVSFLIGVREVNRSPVLSPVPDQVVRPGDLVVFTNSVSDPDLPAQGLRFSLVSGLPGVELDNETGVFRWQVPEDPPAGPQSAVIRVTDDGSPALSHDQTVRFFVDAPFRIAINEIMHRPSTANAEFIELHNWSSAGGVDLSGWILEGYQFVFPPDTVLEPGAFLCVARNYDVFQAVYGNAPAAVGDAVVSIPESGGVIRLLRPIGEGLAEVVDEVSFSLEQPWPSAAVEGASLQLIDVRADHRRVWNWAASAGGIVTNGPVAIATMTDVWRFWESEGTPGSAWRSRSYADQSWGTGRALFFEEGAALPATKNTPLELGRTTYYFRKPFTFFGNPEGARLQLSTILDDGAVFYLNGREVFRLGMAAGTVGASTFASRTVGNAVLEGPFDVPALGLEQGENLIAVEVHQVNANSTDVVFGAEVGLITVSDSRFTPGAPNVVPGEPPLFLVGETDGDGMIRLGWQSLPGVRYRLEATSDIGAGGWEALGDAMGTGSTQWFEDRIPSDGRRRFYRLRRED